MPDDFRGNPTWNSLLRIIQIMWLENVYFSNIESKRGPRPNQYKHILCSFIALTTKCSSFLFKLHFLVFKGQSWFRIMNSKHIVRHLKTKQGLIRDYNRTRWILWSLPLLLLMTAMLVTIAKNADCNFCPHGTAGDKISPGRRDSGESRFKSTSCSLHLSDRDVSSAPEELYSCSNS